MSYQVDFKAEAIAGLELLTSTIQERLLRKIRWLCENFNDLISSPAKYLSLRTQR